MNSLNTSSTESGNGSGRFGWPVVAWICCFIVLAAALQYFVPYPVDDDTAYHFTVGQLIRKYGILQSFPWTPFSWQFDHYGDKEFFFHLLFVPLGGLGFISAARLVGALAGALVLTTLYLVLRLESIRYPGLWALMPLACSEFVFRLALVRPHLLSITLALLIMWAYSRGRLPLLFIAALLYPLSYVAFWQIPLIIIVATEAARLLGGESIRWKPVIAVITGIAVGLAFHPNSFNLIYMNWIHMKDILFQNAWGGKVDFNLGKEFNPYPLSSWLRYFVPVVLMVAASLFVGWQQRRKDPALFAYAISAVIFGLLMAKSLRFVEYFVPFTVAAMAVNSGTLGKRLLAPVLLGLSILYMLTFGTEPWKILASKTAYIEPVIAQHFNRLIPQGAQIFTPGWDYTGNLMIALPERRFIVAADPTLLYKRDPELYNSWRRIPLEAPPDSAEGIRRLFRARYVISLNFEAYWPFFDALSADAKVRNIFSDGKWVVFDLGDPTIN